MSDAPSDNWRPGPDVPRAHGFKLAFCGDPKCGLHIVPVDASDKPICEIVMSAAQTGALVSICWSSLNEKTS